MLKEENVSNLSVLYSDQDFFKIPNKTFATNSLVRQNQFLFFL